MKRFFVTGLLFLFLFGLGVSAAHASEETLTDLSIVFPTLAIESASIAGQSGQKSDVVLSFSEEPSSLTPTIEPDIPPVLIPVSTFLEPKQVKTIQPTLKVLPITSGNVLGISSFFSRFHYGIDIRANVGTPVLAMHSGTVKTVAFEGGGYGRYVVTEHTENGSVVSALYAHLKESVVKEGDKVNATTKIGTVGMTGRTTGPHLHFEVYQDDFAIDPLKYFTNGLPRKIIAKNE